MLRRIVFVLFLLTLGGCSAFRASIGIGLGLGGGVKVGPLEVTALGGGALSWGNCYGIVGSHVTGELGLPGLVRFEIVQGEDGVTRFRAPGLVPIAMAPFFLGDTDEDHNFRALVFDKPGEISASIYALFFAFHLGFDALGLMHDARTYVGLALGGDMPGPTEEDAHSITGPATAPEDDQLGDIPWRVISLDEIAEIDSGTPGNRLGARKKLVQFLDDKTALVQVQDGPVARYVTPRVAFTHHAAISLAAQAELARLREREAARTFEHAENLHDPEAIGEALASYPFAEGVARAALARARILLERGEVEEAVSAYQDAILHMDERDPERGGALGEVLAAARVRTGSRPAPARHASWAGVAEIEGFRVGLGGRSAWAITEAGDVAWERSSALGQDLHASKVLGAQSGLAIVSAIKGERAWLLAMDSAGAVRWSVPLPASSPGCGPLDQVHVLGCGRVFVGRTDRAFALDASSGRVLWMTVRTGPSQPPHETDVKGLDWAPGAGPDRRRPDGVHGFQITLTDRALEITSGTGRHVERLDPRTGDLLP